MKIEHKTITVEQEVYIADDGTVFTDKDDCKVYEIEKLEDRIDCYDLDFEKASIQDCIYIKLVTEEDVKTVKQLCEYYGITDEGIDEPGIYKYNCEFGIPEQWISLDDVLFHIRGGIGK